MITEQQLKEWEEISDRVYLNEEDFLKDGFHYRTAIPLLIEEVRRLREVNADLGDMVVQLVGRDLDRISPITSTSALDANESTFSSVNNNTDCAPNLTAKDWKDFLIKQRCWKE